MKLIEHVLTKPQLLESDRTKLPEGVLCRVVYPICNIGVRNHNNRIYEKKVWDIVLEDSNIKSKLATRTLFGQAEHPVNTTDSNLEKTSHIITRMWLDEGTSKIMAEFDVLDTPYGRIADTILRAGSQLGCSTRADGELEDRHDDTGSYSYVIPESYQFRSVDFTANPSTKESYPEKVERDLVGQIRNGVESKKMDRLYAESILETLHVPEAVTLLEAVKKAGSCTCGNWVCKNCKSCQEKIEKKIAEQGKNESTDSDGVTTCPKCEHKADQDDFRAASDDTRSTGGTEWVCPKCKAELSDEDINEKREAKSKGEVCPECNGSGQDEANPKEECVACAGSGRYEDYKQISSKHKNEAEINWIKVILTLDNDDKVTRKIDADIDSAKKYFLDKEIDVAGKKHKVVNVELVEGRDVTVQKTQVEKTDWVCPHCSKIIGEKELYQNEKGEDFHRSCIDKGPINLPNESKVKEEKSNTPKDKEIEEIGAISKKYGFGSVAWQNALMELVHQKVQNKIPIGPALMSFIHVQVEHMDRVKREEIEALNRQWQLDNSKTPNESKIKEKVTAEQAKEVAGTIAKQLGGINKLAAMIGARNFAFNTDDNGSLSFNFPKAKDDISSVKITLNSMDTYDVDFYSNTKKVKEFKGVYADGLRELIEQTTGLYLSLGTMGENKDKEEKLKCTKCGEDIWDVANVDQGLNKCWNCSMKFDKDESINEAYSFLYDPKAFTLEFWSEFVDKSDAIDSLMYRFGLDNEKAAKFVEDVEARLGVVKRAKTGMDPYSKRQKYFEFLTSRPIKATTENKMEEKWHLDKEVADQVAEILAKVKPGMSPDDIYKLVLQANELVSKNIEANKLKEDVVNEQAIYIKVDGKIVAKAPLAKNNEEAKKKFLETHKHVDPDKVKAVYVDEAELNEHNHIPVRLLQYGDHYILMCCDVVLNHFDTREEAEAWVADYNKGKKPEDQYKVSGSIEEADVSSRIRSLISDMSNAAGKRDYETVSRLANELVKLSQENKVVVDHWLIKKDGEVIKKVEGSRLNAMSALADLSPHLAHHALKYDGYSIDGISSSGEVVDQITEDAAYCNADESIPALKSLAKQANVPVATAERYWKEAKAQVIKRKKQHESITRQLSNIAGETAVEQRLLAMDRQQMHEGLSDIKKLTVNDMSSKLGISKSDAEKIKALIDIFGGDIYGKKHEPLIARKDKNEDMEFLTSSASTIEEAKEILKNNGVCWDKTGTTVDSGCTFFFNAVEKVATYVNASITGDKNGVLSFRNMNILESKKLQPRDYQYIMGVVKKRLGLKTHKSESEVSEAENADMLSRILIKMRDNAQFTIEESEYLDNKRRTEWISNATLDEACDMHIDTKHGTPFKLVALLTGDEAKYLYVRLPSDAEKYKIGDVFYLYSIEEDDDGFWWVTMVDNQALLSKDTVCSRDSGVVRMTPLRLKDVGSVFQQVQCNDKSANESDHVKEELDRIMVKHASDVVAYSSKIQGLTKQLESLKNEITECRKTYEQEKQQIKNESTALTEKTLADNKKEFDEQTKSLTERHIKETEQLRQQFDLAMLRKYAHTKVSTIGLDLPQGALALLEQCRTENEVDATILKLQNTIREGMIHSRGAVAEITVSPVQVNDPVLEQISNSISGVLDRMNGRK